jgi:hypothetical protein
MSVTAAKFRAIALSFPGVLESAHMAHPDFRVNGKIFATLGHPNDESAMVKLTPAQQKSFMRKAPAILTPCAGKWGQRGATSVHLALANVALVQATLKAAYQNVTGAESG